MAFVIKNNFFSNICKDYQSIINSKKPDCTLHCSDGYQKSIHKEILMQTKLLRGALQSAKEELCSACDNFDIFCLSVDKEILDIIVKFFYAGEISSLDQDKAGLIIEDLIQVFGFSLNDLSFQQGDSKQKEPDQNDYDKEHVTINHVDNQPFDFLPIEIENENGDSETMIISNESTIESDSELNCEMQIDVKNENAENPFDYMNDSNSQENKPRRISKSVANMNMKKSIENDLPFLPIKNEMVDKKNVVCETCNMTFHHASNLYRHINNIHKGIKKFVCQVCPRRFTQKMDLRRHMNSFHGKDRTESCPDCGKGYKLITTLRNHVLKQHGYKYDGNKTM